MSEKWNHHATWRDTESLQSRVSNLILTLYLCYYLAWASSRLSSVMAMICWRMSPMSCSGWQLLWRFLLSCGSSTSSPVKPIWHDIWWALFSIPPMWHYQCGGKDGSRVAINEVLSPTFRAYSKLKGFPQKRKGKSGVASAARVSEKIIAGGAKALN